MPRHAAHFRLKLRGPVYQVRFTRKGREHRLSTETGDKGRAKQEAERLVRDHDAGKDCRICGGGGAAVGPAPISELSERFLKECLRTHGAAYQKRATTDMVQYIEERWTDPNAITSKAWEEAKIDWHTKPTERRERLSWGSIANLGNTLRAFMRYCARVGSVASVPELRNPGTKQLAADRAYLRPLDYDEEQAFLWTLALNAEGRALRIYLALFGTWCRKNQLEKATRRWLNLERHTMTIPARYTKHGQHDEEIAIPPRAEEAIREEMAKWGDAPKMDEPIFGGFNYRSLFERMVGLAGIDSTGLTAHHVTRRTSATAGGQADGASLSAMMKQGGWIDPKTVGVYMRPSVEAARKVTR